MQTQKGTGYNNKA